MRKSFGENIWENKKEILAKLFEEEFLWKYLRKEYGANIFKKEFCQKKLNRILSTNIWERILMKIFVKRILSNNIWEKGLQKTFEEKKTFLIKVVEGWNIWKYLKKKKIFNKSSWGVEELREKKLTTELLGNIFEFLETTIWKRILLYKTCWERVLRKTKLQKYLKTNIISKNSWERVLRKTKLQKYFKQK